jgi:hypothetical protein
MAAVVCANALGCGGVDPGSLSGSQDLVTGRQGLTICPYGRAGAQSDAAAPGVDPMIIDPCDPPPPPPPPPPPATPGFLTYTPFSEISVLRVRWGGQYDATSYALDLMTNGVWTRVFTGLATSVDLPLPGNGVYRLRVAACNDNGCSAYRVDEEMRMSFGPDRQTGDAGSAPFSATMAASASLPGLNLLATDSGTHELLPVLGAAYDGLRQELTANRCLDMTGAEIVSQPARLKDYLFTQVRTRDELATSLNLSQSLSVSAKYGKFGGSYSGKKTLLSESTRVEETSMLVASLKDQLRVETLLNHSLRPLDPIFVNMLNGGDTARFRNICGDRYVYSIAYGRQVYLTFQLRSFKYSKDEIRTQTTNLKIDIGTWASMNFDSTKKDEIHAKYEKYEVQVRAISYGSAAVVSSVVDFATGLQYLQDFEKEAPGNEYPFSQLDSDYVPPAGSPFPDYRPIQQALQRWYSFDQQIGTRCEIFDENNYPDDAFAFDTNGAALANGLSLRTACFRMKRAVQENIQNCEDTAKWGRCIEPDAPGCTVPNETDSCVSYANKFPRWDVALASVRLAGYGGYFGSAKTYRGDSCFSLPTMLDLRVAGVDCAGLGGCPAVRKGVNVTTVKLQRASNGWNSWNPTNRCLHAEVTVSGGGLIGTGAYADITHTANGMQPTYPTYLF